MKASIIAFTLSVLAPLVSSVALPESEYPAGITATKVTKFDYPRTVEKRDGLEKRANHGVYLCVNANFPQDGSLCVHIVAPAGVCVPLGLDLEDKVSSVGPDQGAYCRFFFDRGCVDNSGSRHFDTVFPGVPDLSRLGNGASNDQISSYQCWDM
ncbi:uncharacterized protein BDR25DRAFT_311369 [Lindgomyces ingoldianus]|uniref:Uncharacterized protein n=1 Tax=Lindgomyces ingoldianus TaxID=673940 RepID=A0ACB6R726_9PLEO|nr:uncharacterized protein BDR25DRAFT_311369 [Lindgomyces ingoldianus]KAF2474991.1 hypothetical protein BDR25DRAFT_311369 [Lindgomyces ingoldianus]